MADTGPADQHGPLPDWLMRRLHHGPMPLPWDRPWLPPWARQSAGLPAPWQESIGVPSLPEVRPELAPLQTPAAAPVPVRRPPVALRLGFVLFGSLLALPSAIVLFLLAGPRLGWLDWAAYVGGGLLGLTGLAAFWLGLTAPDGT